MNSKFIILFYAFFGLGSCIDHLPSNFKQCHRRAQDFDKCLVEAAQIGLKQFAKGIPELGLPSIEPVTDRHLVVPPGSNILMLEQKWEKWESHGLSTGIVSKFEVNFKNKTIYMDFTVPDFKVECDYEFTGKLLLIPIRAKGPGHVACKNARFTAKFYLDEIYKDGEKYFKVASCQARILPESLTVKFENFLGPEQGILGDILDASIFFNVFMPEMFAEVHVGYDESYGKVFTKVFDMLLEKIPVSKLFGDE